MEWCCLSTEERKRLRRHKEIEKQLLQDKRQYYRQLKMLLLGTGESGKSTFIKQMRIMHGSGYSENDRKGFIPVVFQNIITAIQALIKALKTLNIGYTDDQNTSLAQKLLDVDSTLVSTLENWQVDAIKRVWTDHGIQQCYERRREFQLSDSAKYFLSDMDRISASNYIPTLQDILRVRVPTTGIAEYRFDISNVIFRMLDVRGPRSGRMKWIHCFENFTSVIYLAALSDYDLMLYDDNRLNESLHLFKTILSSRWFQQSSTILLLNKTDQLEEKIRTSHLATYFPSYDGPRCDAESAKRFISKMFQEQNTRHPDTLYTHFICAVDTLPIQLILGDIKDTVLRKGLERFKVE